jgi:hypothetical protein
MRRAVPIVLLALVALTGTASAARGRSGVRAPARESVVKQPMPRREAERLAERLRRRGWDEDRLDLLARELRGRYLGADELLLLLEPFRFSHHRLSALELIAPRRLARDRDAEVVDAFLYRADRVKAREILQR